MTFFSTKENTGHVPRYSSIVFSKDYGVLVYVF